MGLSGPFIFFPEFLFGIFGIKKSEPVLKEFLGSFSDLKGFAFVVGGFFKLKALAMAFQLFFSLDLTKRPCSFLVLGPSTLLS